MGSVIRYLERVLREFESGMVRLRLSIPGIIEYSLVKTVHYSDRLLNLFIYFIKKFSRIANLLQISMLDSMIIVSIWYGVLTLVLMLIVVSLLR